MNSLGPSLIALIGTLIVAAIGLYQWRRQQTRTQSEGSRAATEKAYSAIWEHLHAVEMKLRANEPRADTEISSDTRRLNELIQLNSPHLRADDKALLNTYLAALARVSGLIQNLGSPQSKTEWANTMAPIPSSPDIADGLKELDRLRNEIERRVKASLS